MSLLEPWLREAFSSEKWLVLLYFKVADVIPAADNLQKGAVVKLSMFPP